MNSKMTGRQDSEPSFWSSFWTNRRGQIMQLVFLLGLSLLIALSTIWPKLQVPTYAGLIFVMLPLSTLIPAVRPIFFLDSKWKLALVYTMAIILSYSIVSIFEIVVETSSIFDSAYQDFGLEEIFNPWKIFDDLRLNVGWLYMSGRTYGKLIYCVLLAAPMLLMVGRCTWKELGKKKEFYQGLFWALVFLIVFGLSLLFTTWAFWNLDILEYLRGTAMVDLLFSELGDNLQEFKAHHYQAFSFLFLTISAYFIWMAVLRPSRRYLAGRTRFDPGTLFYLLIIKAILTLLMGVVVFSINLYFKNANIPPLPALLLVYAVTFSLIRIDHYFVLESAKPPKKQKEREPDIYEAVRNRFERNCAVNGAVVLVNLSGGGIQAATWSVSVLNKIREQLNGERAGLGDEFFNAILSISSASGGSVGSMFFLDELNRKGVGGYDPAASLEACNNDVLDVAGYGIAFIDMWRLPITLLSGIGLISKRAQHRDRGWALEREWDYFIRNRGREANAPRLEDWRESVLEGEIPIPIFQSTIANEGRLMLISPISLSAISNDFPNVVDFRKRFSDLTLKVSTAARLSATFPYISPICRSITEEKGLELDKEKGQEIYAADGGYFENYGVFTSIQLLDHLLGEGRRGIGIRRVLVLNIEAFPARSKGWGQRNSLREGLSMAFIGPVKSIMGALFKSQKAKNRGLLRVISSQGYYENVEIETVTIPFPELYAEGKSKPYSPPLSWKLTRSQKSMNQLGVAHISDPARGDEKGFGKVVALWRKWGGLRVEE